MRLQVVILLVWSRISICDIYLHNPRGSNNRLNENGRNVANNKRLFNSQNNNRGGYNVGNVYYLAGSKLQIEWTAQHSCADMNNHCTIILQYMCSANLRDGADTRQIPLEDSDCRNSKCSEDIRFGMHENNEYYLQCKARQRNNGLFLADQNLRGRNSAIFTRQDRLGTRYGYECPEERDYYPYWYASPWKDIAVLTSDAKRCQFYRDESANVKSRWECRVPIEILKSKVAGNQILPNTRSACEKELNGTWTETKPHNIPPPVCIEPQWTRDNQLGNTVNGYMPSFNWTIPSGEKESDLCTLRARYNISTSDYDGWLTFSNGIQSTDYGSKFGFSNSTTALNRGYQFKQTPEVKPFAGSQGSKLELQLAVNTNQYGRVFQDRSHGFSIKASTVENSVVHNVNVRGKRGNIVQVYPSVEYDFTPNTLNLKVDDYVHFQWTGSNNNNGNNDGQGRAGSDRSNVLLQASAAYDQAGPSYKVPAYGHWGRSYPEIVGSDLNTTMFGLNRSDLEKLAFSGSTMGDVEELDDAGTYFDLGPRKITRTGIAYYMCTRNNNFSNRSQKGRLVCGANRILYLNVGVNGGKISVDNGNLVMDVPPNAFSSLETFRVESWSSKEGADMLKEGGIEPPNGDAYASDFFSIGFSSKASKNIPVSMKISDTSYPVSAYRGNAESLATWERLDIKQESNGFITFSVDKDGIFVIRNHSATDAPLIIGLVIMFVVIIAVVGILIYLERTKQVLSQFSQNFRSKV